MSLPPPNYPHFFMKYENRNTGEVNTMEVNHETGYLFTHQDAFRDRDHLFIREKEKDKPSRMIGATIFRAEVTMEKLGTDFDDIANYMIENDFYHLHKPYVEGQDELVYQNYQDQLIQKELTDLGDTFPDDWS